MQDCQGIMDPKLNNSCKLMQNGPCSQMHDDQCLKSCDQQFLTWRNTDKLATKEAGIKVLTCEGKWERAVQWWTPADDAPVAYEPIDLLNLSGDLCCLVCGTHYTTEACFTLTASSVCNAR